MTKEKLWVSGALAAVFLIGVGIILFTAKPEALPLGEEGVADERMAAYTLAEVMKHASEDDCWTAVGGSVYDLSTWVKDHPGGDRAILSICGIDGTQAFQGRHGGEGGPEAALANYKIGLLTE